MECVNCWMKIYATANSRKGALCSSVTLGIGGRFGGDLEYKVVLSQVSPHRRYLTTAHFLGKI